jgi:hypothetical protein
MLFPSPIKRSPVAVLDLIFDPLLADTAASASGASYAWIGTLQPALAPSSLRDEASINLKS